MIVRAATVLSALALAGCVAPPHVVIHGEDKTAAKAPTARFQELASPGGAVAKNPQAAPPMPEPTAIFPVKADVTPAEAPRGLLIPAPTPDPALVLALRDYLEGRTDKAVERIRDLDPANQEMILRLLPALVQAAKADLSGRAPADAAVLASQLEAAMGATSKLAQLSIRKACYVSRVAQFGVYDPMPEKYRFLPGGAGVLYLELQNAPSVPSDIPAGGHGFVTRLNCSHFICDAEGKALSSPKTQPHAVFTRSPVKDYFLKLEFEMPPQPGNYSLVVEIADAAGRKARQQVELRVGS